MVFCSTAAKLQTSYDPLDDDISSREVDQRTAEYTERENGKILHLDGATVGNWQCSM